MKNEEFLNFLNSEFQTAKSSLDANESLGNISKELESDADRYQESTLIDQGGMKLINRVHDRVTDRFLVSASSKNPEDKNAREHFLREARITASLQHPNIVPIHDIGFDSKGEPFFIMKMIDGVSFNDYLKEEHSTQAKLRIFLKICDAIDFAHSQGVVHLDLKPANVRVGKHGEVIVCDWGLAKVIYVDCNEDLLSKDSLDSCNLQLTLYGRGTPGFMAPEQFKNDESPTRKSDIFSLGAILYNILTGQAPLYGKDYEQIKHRTISGEITPPSLQCPNKNIPMSLEAICMKALSPKPEERYLTINELISEIQAYLNGFAPKAEKAGFATQLRLLYYRNRSIIQLSLATIILIFSGLFWFISELKSNENKIRDAFNELQTEVDLRIEAEAEALKGLKREIWAQLKQANLDAANDHLKLALHYTHNDPEVLRQAVLVYMAQFDFKKASKYALLLPVNKAKHLREKIRTLQDADPDNIPYMLVIREFQNEAFGRLYHQLIKKAMPTLPVNKKQELVRQLIYSLNQQVKHENILFANDSKDLKIESDSLYLIPPLDGSGIENIDVSDTSLKKIYTLNSMSILKLNLAGNPIGYLDVSTEFKKNLTHLNLQRTHFTYIPNGLDNLENLNISYCKIGAYGELLK